MTGRAVVELNAGWELARTEPDACLAAADTATAGLTWVPAQVPGTTAGALGDAGRDLDHDDWDWWFRVRFTASPASAGEELVLCLAGLATVAEVYLNGASLLHSESMYVAHEIDVGERLTDGPDNELLICCRALAPRLAIRRRPRARWRTQLVSSPNLRFFRTMLLGRTPGFAPGPAAVGPWRPVTLERRQGLICDAVALRPRLDADDGVMVCRGRLRDTRGCAAADQVLVTVTGCGTPVTEYRVWLTVDGDGCFAGEVHVPEVQRWWPHTHGRPALYDVVIAGEGGEVLHRARTGFRTLEAAGDLEADGLDLHINGQPVFVRGGVWTPLSLTDPYADRERLFPVLQRLVAAGLNMLRVPGIGCWESSAFHDLCDELGILVWQDFMFANLDYPESDEQFMDAVAREGSAALAQLAGRPSTSVVCGGSEVAQQVAMLGLDPALAEGPLYGELLPRLVAEAELEAPYVPSAPWGGDLPFRPDRGVANYYGVGAYLRPLSDARRAQVRFAAECLAFANIPDDEALEALGPAAGAVVHHPRWKAGVPRDAGAGWDFDDVRDHYLRTWFGVDPLALRYSDPSRFLELSRAVSGEVMAETFGEWRRAESPCAGALVLWCKDLVPGAGWGLLDHRGGSKVALHHLRRALAPVAVWGSDEGLGGLVAHVANDRPEPLDAQLRIALYRDGEILTEQTTVAIVLPAHAAIAHNVEALLGRFVDITWAYRFGPPAADVVALTLERATVAGETEILSQAFRFPAGRAPVPEPATRLGLQATIRTQAVTNATVVVSSVRFADGVRVLVPGWSASDDAFCVEPGHARMIELVREGDATDAGPPVGGLTALNLAGRVRIAPDG